MRFRLSPLHDVNPSNLTPSNPPAGHRIYQPVYLGPRADIPASECVVEQLKYKAQAQAA